MAKRRMIDPGIWEDKDFNALQPWARLLFIAAMSNADDYGRLSGHPADLKAYAFRYDDISLADVENLRDQVAERMRNFKIYTVDGHEWLQFLKWTDHQKIREDRRAPSRIPPMPENCGQLPDKPQAAAVQTAAQYSIGKISIVKDRAAAAKTPQTAGKANETIKAIFDFWNGKGLTKHRELNDATVGSLNARLKAYSAQEIKDAITNYAEISLDKTGRYFWTHNAWTLKEFLQRGIERFTNEAEPKKRWLNKDQRSEAVHADTVAETYNRQEARTSKEKAALEASRKHEQERARQFNALTEDARNAYLAEAKQELEKNTKPELITKTLIRLVAIDTAEKDGEIKVKKEK